MKNKELKDYLQTLIAQSENRTKGMTMDVNRIIPKYGESFLAYDFSENGADFILSQGDKKIVIEVGSGQKIVNKY
ncbi:MAG: hypothetical protein PHU17_02235 [Candidatus Pacebacteria bacterium]|nr:hypothetical protein [Candidatus Paceibacterota bacterium]MDD4074315.1 hypothetical protein [Candidatus Paceibacterota bacterium]